MLEFIIFYVMSLTGCSQDAMTYRISVADDSIQDLYASFAWETISALREKGGWEKAGVEFCYDPFDPDVDIVLALPDSVDRLCAPIKTEGEVSCSINGRAVINFKRWTQGTRAWDDLSDYRRYVINHEVGHAMGMIHRHNCTKSGKAPLMMQQSRNRLKCEPNSYPTSHEAKSLRRYREENR